MSEAAGGHEQFRSIPIEFRLYKVRQLLALIDKHMLHGITTNLKWDEFRCFDACLPEAAKGKPYGALFFGILENALQYQKDFEFFPHKMQLDFDEQGAAGRYAIHSYNMLMDLAERFPDTPEFARLHEFRQIMERTPQMLDDKQYLPLQAADMLAWSLRFQMEPEETVKSSPFAWLYDEIRKTVWPGCTRFNMDYWKALGDVLKLARPV
jgi:hypothetical protein